MIKVVEVISDTNIGGAGRLLLARLEESDRLRFDETVILPRASKLCPRLEDLGVKYIEIDGCADRSLDIFAILKLWREIRRVRPHISASTGHVPCQSDVAGYVQLAQPRGIGSRSSVLPHCSLSARQSSPVRPP